jgi:hypothetical protein
MQFAVFPISSNPSPTAQQTPQTLPYRLRRGVTLLAQDDMARLLDLEQGRFYALNGTGARLLTLALEAGPEEAVTRVAREHGVEEERVRADWARLVSVLQRRRLLTSRRSVRRRVLPGRLGLALLLALAWVSLRLLGWAQTIRLWQGEQRPAAEPWQPALEPLVRQLDQAVRGAGAVHPLNPQCKERAIVAWHILCNRWSLPAELIVGVLAFPFEAHAWVECGPLTVTDERARCSLYIPAARYQ